MSKSKKEIVIEFTAALLSSKDPGKKVETIPGIVKDAIEAADLIEKEFEGSETKFQSKNILGAGDGNVSKTFKKQ